MDTRERPPPSRGECRVHRLDEEVDGTNEISLEDGEIVPQRRGQKRDRDVTASLRVVRSG